jgi:hypothetical protein
MKLFFATALIFLSGCLTPGPNLGYVADRDMHPVGWDCPKGDDQSHWIAFLSPPCTWVPGGMFFKSCYDRYAANVMESRGCTQTPQTAATTGGASSAH